jgi:hypothetical protein
MLLRSLHNLFQQVNDRSRAFSTEPDPGRRTWTDAPARCPPPTITAGEIVLPDYRIPAVRHGRSALRVRGRQVLTTATDSKGLGLFDTCPARAQPWSARGRAGVGQSSREETAGHASTVEAGAERYGDSGATVARRTARMYLCLAGMKVEAPARR